MEEGRYISLTEASAQFGLSRSQLKLLAKTGKLRAFRIGRSWATTPEAVAEYLANTELRKRGPHKEKST